MSQIDYVLPEVSTAIKAWTPIRDVVNGENAVKARSPSYLPYLVPSDKSPDNVQRNLDYATRAVFYGVTKRTLKGMVGQVTGKPAVLTVPELLMMLQDDVDGGAVSIEQQSKQALSDTLSVGRLGLLTDYPNVEPGTAATRQDLLDGRIRPSIQYYFAEQIINWRVEMVKGLRKLTLVVLAEKYTKSDDGFKKEEGDQWRVLRLVDNVYIVQVFRKDESGQFVVMTDLSTTPRDANGKTFDEILFTFVGSDNNDPGIDDAPLMDMASLNLAHYRNSADHEESVFIVGQPTPVLSGLTQEWVTDVWNNKDVMPNGVAVGSRNPIPLPAGGEATLLQADPNTLVFEAMKHKEEQMKALGAKLVEPKVGNRTLGEAQMDEASEASVLMTCAKNVSAAYTRCLKWAARLVGAAVTDDIAYELNTDFEISRMTTEMRGQLMKEWQAGAISFTEYRAILRRAGVATQDDADAQEEIDQATEKDVATQVALMGSNDPAANDSGSNSPANGG
jgi:hypothetical protein